MAAILIQPPQGHATSAIADLPIAEIRRALSKLRESHLNSTPQNPLFLCDKLHGDRSIAEFSKEFVFGHHLKRHFKSVAQGNIVSKRNAKLTPLASAASLTQSTGASGFTTAVPGPKGDLHDPFPFTAHWVPKTQRGKRAFADAVTGTVESQQEQQQQQPSEKKVFTKTE
jgi:hypothetical protein